MRVLGMLALILITVDARACRELQWTASEWAEASEAVYIGEIVSASTVPVSVEEQDKADGSRQTIRSALFNSGGDKLVTVHVTDTLKGQPAESLSIIVPWCDGGLGNVGDKAAAFQLGSQWHIKSSSEAILEVKAALTKPSI